MSLLFESIRVEDGKFQNLVYHEQRMKRSLHALYGIDEPFDLEEELSHIPLEPSGLFKCKLIYDDVSRRIELNEYKAREVKRLKIVEHNRINYEFKYTDRKLLDHLFSLRETCDDVLILKRGMVTDTSYANIAFKRENKWYTPWEPLLKGTMRQELLEFEKIQEEEISRNDIKSFEVCKIFNAMLRFDSEEIAIDNIVF
jgi:4-amino-4-deoxychorismate lyase